MKQMLKILLIIVIVLYSNFAKAIPIPGTIAPGTPVIDLTAAANAIATIENLKQQLEYNKMMIEQLGKGEFTPSSITYLGDIYTRCVGKKWVLPEFMPNISINICSKDADKRFETWYKQHILIDISDSFEIIQHKKQELIKKQQAIRSDLLTNSAKQIQFHAEKDNDAIKALQENIKKSKTQIEVLKVQAQIQLQILQELQTVKANQALMMQATGLRE